MKKIMMLFLFLVFSVGPVGTTLAAPYEGYNYSFWGDTMAAPLPFLPDRLVDGNQLNIGPFKDPEDFTVTKDNEIYVVDTGNNRIVAMDSDWNVIREIETFQNGDKEEVFNQPSGIFINNNQEMYIADTGSKRIIVLTLDGQFVQEVDAPKSDVLREGFVYMPVKVVVDSANRVYVISRGGYDGIVQFSSSGNFTGFIGLSEVKFDPMDLFWKRISTKEQRSKMELFIPSEFSNVDIDQDGFIYATSAEEFGTPMRRLNPSGVDVLRRSGYIPIAGDAHVGFNGSRMGPSKFISAAVEPNGIYSALDSTRGRIFTYDRDGKLLYQFGSLGEQFGNFSNPVEIDTMGDQLIVLDKGFAQLTVFKPTRYGKVIKEAAIYTDLGEEIKATAAWEEVRKLNNNLEFAYLGIGKTELREGKNLEAMGNFKLGTSRDYYSRAFERYRKDYMWNHFGTIAAIILGSIAAIIVAFRLRKPTTGEPGVVGTAWLAVFHPFRGFWDAKYEKKGRVWLALVLLLILAILMILKQQYSGFIFNLDVMVYDAKTMDAVKFVIMPFFLWCIANWSLTTLMNGEGKFKEIVTVTGYALIPLVLVQIPLILMSNVLTVKEASFYTLMQNFASIWFLWLIFVGMQTVHQYTIKKTIVTMGLTMVVIGIFLFIGLLFTALLQEMLSFGSTVYKEIMFRIGEG
ncbi:YIP1 family protein [Cohnella yongneupensis]|uniref:YIP1 family protein n=1 Tax=Cohnella yongneupensis TaxID=425006 RepID=A0ABW0QWY4_9BACL